VLERVKAQVGHVRRFGVTEDAKHAAFVVEMVVEDLLPIHEVFTLSLSNAHRTSPGKIAQAARVRTIVTT
jgi:hypothetical protein